MFPSVQNFQFTIKSKTKQKTNETEFPPAVCKYLSNYKNYIPIAERECNFSLEVNEKNWASLVGLSNKC